MSNFYLVCGISGGGKTVLSQRIVEKNPEKIDAVIDPDDYYAKINGDERIRDNFFDVWEMLKRDIHNYEMENKNVLVNTNCLSESQRREFIEYFPTFNHHLIWVISPFEKCLEGNRSRIRHVPEDVLTKQWYKMEFPNASEEGWDTICHITNFWEDEKYIIFNLKGDVRNILKI